VAAISRFPRGHNLASFHVRILHVIADLDARKGGPAAACLGLAKLMSRRGHQVRIVTADRGFVAGDCPRVNGLEIEALPGSWPAFFGTSWSMARRLREVIANFDVIHIHALYLFHDWTAARHSWSFARPYILMPHGALDPFIYRRHRWRKYLIEAAFQDEVSRRAAGLHYTTAEEWQLARPHTNNSRGCILSIGIDLDEFEHLPARSVLRERYPIIGERKVVLFLGRLNYKKGVDVVIEAFSRVAQRRNDIFLVLAGPDDGIREEAEALIAQRGVAERSLFTGMVSGDEKRIVLAGSDVFLLASQSENFGISVVEAAACGIPAVVSERVNLWREFHHAEAALTAPPAISDFSERLEFLLENPEVAEKLGRRAAEFARSRFSWDALGSQYEEMYSRVQRDRVLPDLA
jgi:glycosyltransferase involved in cell wall biosynthesis